MTRPILQYRPLDRGFLLCLPGESSVGDWQRALRNLPGNLHGRDRLTPARARAFLPDGRLVETHTVPLRWQRALPWLASMATEPERVGGSLAFWGVALRLLQSLVLRGALLPQLDTRGNPWRATWGISLTSPMDREAVDQLMQVHAAVGAGLPRGRQLEPSPRGWRWAPWTRRSWTTTWPCRPAASRCCGHSWRTARTSWCASWPAPCARGRIPA